jgi:uncharacterized phage protein gp47/JayE
MSGSNSGSSYVAGTVRGFTTLMQGMAAAVQAGATVAIDLTTGSVLRAALEAYAGVTLWLEALVLQVMTMMRLSTSAGADVDSFVNDWQFTRLGAVASTADSVVFSRFTATDAATIPAGATCMTSDGTQGFTVVADPTQSTWNAALGAYVIPAATASATLTVQAAAPGADGNVAAGSITLLTSVIVGVDAIANTSAAAGGINGESDAATKARFALYIGSLARSTVAAIEYAVTSLQPGLDVNVVENYNVDDVWQPGSFFVVVDDGSGDPPASLITAAENAVNAYRAASVRYNVYAPSVLAIDVSVLVTSAAGYLHATVTAAVAAAIDALILSTRIQGLLPYAAVTAACMNVPGVANIADLTVNVGVVDIQATAVQVMRPGTTTVS